jgi:hypothetical protein
MPWKDAMLKIEETSLTQVHYLVATVRQMRSVFVSMATIASGSEPNPLFKLTAPTPALWFWSACAMWRGAAA